MKVHFFVFAVIFNLTGISSHSFAQTSQQKLGELRIETYEKMEQTVENLRGRSETIDPSTITLQNFPKNYRDLKFTEDDNNVNRSLNFIKQKMQAFETGIKDYVNNIPAVEKKIQELDQYGSELSTREARSATRYEIQREKNHLSYKIGQIYLDLVKVNSTITKASSPCSLLCRETLAELSYQFIDFIEQSIDVIEIPENSLMSEEKLKKEVNIYFDVFGDNFLIGIAIMPPFLGLPYLSHDLYDGKLFGFNETMRKLRKENKKSLDRFSRKYEQSLVENTF